jgi:hypothetical protein
MKMACAIEDLKRKFKQLAVEFIDELDGPLGLIK